MDIGGFLLFILSLVLVFMTYICIRWGVVVVKKTNYPTWLSRLNPEQYEYIKSFVSLRKDDAERLDVDLNKKMYQYQYYKIKRIFGSPVTWNEKKLSKQQG